MSNKKYKKELKRAKQLLKETQKFQKKYAKRFEEKQQKTLDESIELLRQAVLQKHGDLTKRSNDLETLSNHLFKPYRKGIIREYIESILVAVLIALVLRTFLVEPFKIPSGSMIPTLAIGDHIFVNKLAYGIWIPFLKKKMRIGSGPKRGDVIVFIYPKDPTKDFIKRVVGLPGDTIEVKGMTLYINGKAISKKRGKFHHYKEQNEYTKQWEEQQGRIFTENIFGAKHQILHSESGLFASNWSSSIDAPQNVGKWGPKVKKGYVFVMGDNRDFSSDSREWGLVPFKNIKGNAFLIWISVGGGNGIHWKRFFSCISPHRGFLCLQ